MLADNLIGLRKSKKISRNEMTDTLRINRQAYAKFEKGQAEPDIQLLSKIADFFEVSVDFLIGRTEYIKENNYIHIENENEELGELLKRLRGNKSLRQVADITQLSHTYISDIEKGFRRDTRTPINPSPDTLKRMSDAYNFPYEEMLRVAGYLEVNIDTTHLSEYQKTILEWVLSREHIYPDEKKKNILELLDTFELIYEQLNNKKRILI